MFSKETLALCRKEQKPWEKHFRRIGEMPIRHSNALRIFDPAVIPFVPWSAQNIDREVTIYKAYKQTGRMILLDLYTIDILEQLGEFYDLISRIISDRNPLKYFPWLRESGVRNR